MKKFIVALILLNIIVYESKGQVNLIEKNIIELFYGVPLKAHLYDVKKIMESTDLVIGMTETNDGDQTEGALQTNPHYDNWKYIGGIKKNSKMNYLPPSNDKENKFFEVGNISFLFNKDSNYDILNYRQISANYEKNQAKIMDNQVEEINSIFAGISYKTIKIPYVIEGRKVGDKIEYYSTSANYQKKIYYLLIVTEYSDYYGPGKSPGYFLGINFYDGYVR